MSKNKENAIPIGNAIESENISKTYISGEIEVQALKNYYQMILMPKNDPHALRAIEKYKMMLIMIRSK